MLLLVGLGNPNPNNSNNRHNVGFLVIDAINEKFKLSKSILSDFDIFKFFIVIRGLVILIINSVF